MQAESETKTNEITAVDSSLFKLNKEVKQLTEDVSEATASLEEATQKRTDEHDTYLSAKKEAEDGIQGSRLALDIMADYYRKQSGSALLQSSAKPGVNMGDYMAEAHERSAGVLGMLEVLKSDFERTKTTLDADEASALSDFNALKSDLENDIEQKNEDIATKNGEIKEKEVEKNQKEQELDAAQNRLEIAHEKLDAMRGMCTENEESYEERRRKRQEEIDHLEKTMGLLNELIQEGH